MKRKITLSPGLLKSAGAKSYELALAISAGINAKLESSAFPDTYTFYHPQHVGLQNAYSVWKTKVAARKRATIDLNNLINGLPAAAYAWSLAIEIVYPKGSGQYVELMPKGRTIFSSGKHTTRINAIAQLSLSLTGITALASVKTSVDAYLANINTANNAQKGGQAIIDAKKKMLDDQRTNAVESQIYVLAEMMKEFNNDIEQVNSYFPMDLIRRPMQAVFTGTSDAESYTVITRRALKAGAQIVLKNIGAVNSVEYYLSDTKFGGIPEGTTPIIVGPGRGTKVPVEELGDLDNKFLIVRNTTAGDALWEVSFS